MNVCHELIAETSFLLILTGLAFVFLHQFFNFSWIWINLPKSRKFDKWSWRLRRWEIPILAREYSWSNILGWTKFHLNPIISIFEFYTGKFPLTRFRSLRMILDHVEFVFVTASFRRPGLYWYLSSQHGCMDHWCRPSMSCLPKMLDGHVEELDVSNGLGSITCWVVYWLSSTDAIGF